MLSKLMVREKYNHYFINEKLVDHWSIGPARRLRLRPAMH